MENVNSIKSRMKAFYEGLVESDTIRAEVKASSPVAARFFSVAIPATVVGLAIGLTPEAKAEEVAHSLPVVQASVNGEEIREIPSMLRLAENKQQAEAKYGDMIFRGENDRLMACEMVLGDTFNEMAKERAKRMSWLLSYSKDKETTEMLTLLDLCLDGKEEVALPKTHVNGANRIANDVITIGYQNHALEQNINAFNQAIIDDAGNTIQSGPATPAQAFSQHVRDKTSAAGWAAAAFSIAEGIARVTGNNEIASHANKGAYFSNKGDRYYRQGKNEASRDNAMRGAQGIGRILNDMGRDAEIERRRQGNGRYSY